MSKLKLFLTIGLIMGFVFIAGVVNAEDVYVMKFAFQMANDIYASNEASFANAFKGHVESASNGRIKVELYPGGVMGKERENFVNVKNNVIQATLSSVGESASVGPGLLSLIIDHQEYGDILDNLDINRDSKILFISTEGDTDPLMHKKIVWDGLYPVL